MIGYALPFRWPDDPRARAEVEARALWLARDWVHTPRAFRARMLAAQPAALAEVVRDLLAHWPPGPDRPEAIAELDADLGAWAAEQPPPGYDPG